MEKTATLFNRQAGRQAVLLQSTEQHNATKGEEHSSILNALHFLWRFFISRANSPEREKERRIHHVGYLVKRMEEAVSEFQKLGFEYDPTLNYAEKIVTDNIRKIKIAFMVNGSYRIELIQPLDKDSPIYGLLKKYKNSPYHICYVTSDIDAEIEILRNAGWALFAAPEIAPAINNCKVAFMMGANSGMLELVQITD